MSKLTQSLLSTLERSGFNHDALQELSKQCSRALTSEAEPIPAEDKVGIFVIGRACFEIADWLDANSPVSVSVHEQCEQTVLPALQQALQMHDGLSISGKMDVLSRLLSAVLTATK